MIVLQDYRGEKKRREECEEWEYENEIIAAIVAGLMDELNKVVKPRSAPFYRKRWDTAYLRDLAEREFFVVAEYRLDPRQFDNLHEMISPMIDKTLKSGNG